MGFSAVYGFTLSLLFAWGVFFQDMPALEKAVKANAPHAEMRHRIYVFADGVWFLLANIIGINSLAAMSQAGKKNDQSANEIQPGNQSGEKPLAFTKREKLLAVFGGIPCGPLGMATVPPAALCLINRFTRESDRKTNGFLIWSLAGIPAFYALVYSGFGNTRFCRNLLWRPNRMHGKRGWLGNDTNRQPMSSGATCSAGRVKKGWGSAGRVLVAMGVAWGMGGGKEYQLKH